jgi:hypothetical protein
MNAIHAEITLAAPAALVWDTLMDFEAYPDWNPFITEIAGERTLGSRLSVFLKPPGQAGMRFRPRVLKAERNAEFRWLGNLFVPGLFDGEHYFLVREIGPNTTRFVQGETFRGLLLPLLGGTLGAAKAGFEAMNAALKARVEASSSPGVLA